MLPYRGVLVHSGSSSLPSHTYSLYYVLITASPTPPGDASVQLSITFPSSVSHTLSVMRANFRGMTFLSWVCKVSRYWVREPPPPPLSPLLLPHAEMGDAAGTVRVHLSRWCPLGSASDRPPPFTQCPTGHVHQGQCAVQMYLHQSSANHHYCIVPISYCLINRHKYNIINQIYIFQQLHLFSQFCIF